MKLKLLLLTCAVLLGACATPKTIVSSTRRGKKAKFLYHQPSLSGLKTGVVSCRIKNAEGNLSECKNVAIRFKD